MEEELFEKAKKLFDFLKKNNFMIKLQMIDDDDIEWYINILNFFYFYGIDIVTDKEYDKLIKKN